MAAACDLIAKFVNIFINVKKIRIFFHSSLSLCCWPKSIMLGKNPANSSAISAAPGPRPCQMEVLHCRGGLWASVVSSYIWFMAKVLLKAFSNPPLFSSIPTLRKQFKNHFVFIHIYLSNLCHYKKHTLYFNLYM